MKRNIHLSIPGRSRFYLGILLFLAGTQHVFPQTRSGYEAALKSTETGALLNYVGEHKRSSNTENLFKWIYDDANAGNANAQAALAYIYTQEIGVDEDLSKAEYWAKKGFDRGSQDAKLVLAILYLNSEREAYQPGDYEKGLRYLEDVASAGYPGLAYDLASVYEYGDDDFNIPEDHAKSLYWFKVAASQGDMDAQVELGDIYLEGTLGVEKDEALAAEWYKKAADKGDSDAIENLNDMFPTDARYGTSIWEEDYRAWRNHYVNVWKPVREKDTKAGYEAYLNQYRGRYPIYSDFAEFAVDYSNVDQSHVSDIKIFLDKYEDTKWERTNTYVSLSEKYYYEVAEAAQTIEAYENYLSKHPWGTYANVVKQKLGNLHYKKAEDYLNSNYYYTAKVVVENYNAKSYATAEGKNRLDVIYQKVLSHEAEEKRKQAAQAAEAERMKKEEAYNKSMHSADKRIFWGVGNLALAGISGYAGYLGIMMAANAGEEDWRIFVGVPLAILGGGVALGSIVNAFDNFKSASSIRARAKREYYSGMDVRISPLYYPRAQAVGLGVSVWF